MFTINAVKTKAGTVGQVVMGNSSDGYVDPMATILWESEPFPTEMGERGDKLGRTNQVDVSYDKATKAARDKIAEVLERLFA